MMIQLKPPIPVDTPKGSALAHVLVDYGFKNNLQWVCFQNETGECWVFHIVDRSQKNITYGKLVK